MRCCHVGYFFNEPRNPSSTSPLPSPFPPLPNLPLPSPSLASWVPTGVKGRVGEGDEGRGLGVSKEAHDSKQRLIYSRQRQLAGLSSSRRIWGYGFCGRRFLFGGVDGGGHTRHPTIHHDHRDTLHPAYATPKLWCHAGLGATPIVIPRS